MTSMGPMHARPSPLIPLRVAYGERGWEDCGRCVECVCEVVCEEASRVVCCEECGEEWLQRCLCCVRRCLRRRRCRCRAVGQGRGRGRGRGVGLGLRRGEGRRLGLSEGRGVGEGRGRGRGKGRGRGSRGR